MVKNNFDEYTRQSQITQKYIKFCNLELVITEAHLPSMGFLCAIKNSLENEQLVH